MSLKKTATLYEILVRFDANGYRGAHVIDLETVTDGDEVIAERPLAPRPVEPAEVKTILGAQNARMIQSTDRVIGQLQETRGERDTLKLAVEKANQAQHKAEKDLALRDVELERANLQIERMTARLEKLEGAGEKAEPAPAEG